MIGARTHKLAREFARDDSGTTLFEYALAISAFLMLFFGLIDFGRMGFHYVNAEKAMQVAARVAAVRPAACSGVPAINGRGSASPAPPFGTNCGAGANICASPGTITCDGDGANQTAAEIWAIVQGTLPNTATIDNLQFSYATDPNLGFLGGPYVPVVTVELQNLTFEFVSPLGQLVALTGATPAAGLGSDIAFPALSASLPAEDLALGTDG